jgi:protein gp37
LGETTNIEWADATWNPWHGCTKISPGCKFCYMYREKIRYGQDPKKIVRGKTTFDEPLKWARGVGLERNEAGEKIVPHFIFTCSWSDWFIEEADAWRPEAWRIIRATPEFTYLILTKRPWRIADRLPPDWGKSGYPNVWLGVSAENQKYAEQRIPFLLREPAAKKFLSLEPLLAPIDLRNLSIDDPLHGKIALDALTGRTYIDGKWNGFFCGGGVDWVIVGGESGSLARPMDPAAVRSLRDQVTEHRRPPKYINIGGEDVLTYSGNEEKARFFFKQWGEWAPPDQVSAKAIAFARYDKERNLYKVGSEAAGNKLDGVHWLEMPDTKGAA